MAGTKQDGDVGGVDDGAAAAFAFRAQGAGIAEAGGIDQDARAQFRKFDDFPDRVGGRAGQFAHQRDFLSRQGVYEGRFPTVGRPEESDLEPVHQKRKSCSPFSMRLRRSMVISRIRPSGMSERLFWIILSPSARVAGEA